MDRRRSGQPFGLQAPRRAPIAEPLFPSRACRAGQKSATADVHSPVFARDFLGRLNRYRLENFCPPRTTSPPIIPSGAEVIGPGSEARERFPRGRCSRRLPSAAASFKKSAKSNGSRVNASNPASQPPRPCVVGKSTSGASQCNNFHFDTSNGGGGRGRRRRKTSPRGASRRGAGRPKYRRHLRKKLIGCSQ